MVFSVQKKSSLMQVGQIEETIGERSMREYTIVTEQEEGGRWIASIEEDPECVSYGETEEEAVEDVKDLHDDYLLLSKPGVKENIQEAYAALVRKGLINVETV